MATKYIKIYQGWTEEPIPEGFDVHHLDMDHSNNAPHNLVAIPHELHRNIHSTYMKLMSALSKQPHAMKVIDPLSCKALQECLSKYQQAQEQLFFYLVKRTFSGRYKRETSAETLEQLSPFLK